MHLIQLKMHFFLSSFFLFLKKTFCKILFIFFSLKQLKSLTRERSATDTYKSPTKRLNDLNDLRGGYIKHDDGERNDDE